MDWEITYWRDSKSPILEEFGRWDSSEWDHWTKENDSIKWVSDFEYKEAIRTYICCRKGNRTRWGGRVPWRLCDLRTLHLKIKDPKYIFTNFGQKFWFWSVRISVRREREKLHADDMADCGIEKGAITGEIIFKARNILGDLVGLRNPSMVSTARICTEIPVSFSQNLSYFL